MKRRSFMQHVVAAAVAASFLAPAGGAGPPVDAGPSRPRTRSARPGCDQLMSNALASGSFSATEYRRRLAACR